MSKDFSTERVLYNFLDRHCYLEGFKKHHDITFQNAASESKSMDHGRMQPVKLIAV